MSKICSKCHILKPLEAFTKAKTKDGRYYSCRECRKKQRVKLKEVYKTLPKIITSKICSKCKIEKKIEEYHNSLLKKDGKSSQCKSCKKKLDKKYNLENKDKIANYMAKRWRENEEVRNTNKLCKEINRFGFNVSDFIKDKYCKHCGITNKQHLLKYNERLHIDHIGNDGRKNQRLGITPNNKESNLQILCRSCHVKKDNKFKDYSKFKNTILDYEKAEEIRVLYKQGIQKKEIARRFSIKSATVYQVISNKTWNKQPSFLCRKKTLP